MKLKQLKLNFRPQVRPVISLGFATLLSIACTWVSCSSEDDVTTSLFGGAREITFRALGDRAATKASTVETAGDIRNFVLSAYWTNAGASNDQKRIFNAAVVTRTEGAGWEYFPKKTWPETDEVRFFAYSPAGSPNVKEGFLGKDVDDIAVTYTVPENPNQQEDLLVAVTDELSSSVGDVQLNFKHALSRVQFRARSGASGVDVRIHGIRLNGLYSTGTWQLKEDAPVSSNGFTPNPDGDISTGVPTGTGGFQYATYGSYATSAMPQSGNTPAYLVPSAALGSGSFWVLDKTKGKTHYDAELSEAVQVGNSYTPVTSSLQGLMVMPQQTENAGGATPGSDDFYVEVTYSIGGANPTTKKVPVSDWWGKTWGSFCFELGRRYVFDITVGSNGQKITVSPNAVAGWDAAINPVPRPTSKAGTFIKYNGFDAFVSAHDLSSKRLYLLLGTNAQGQSSFSAQLDTRLGGNIDASSVAVLNDLCAEWIASVGGNASFSPYPQFTFDKDIAHYAGGFQDSRQHIWLFSNCRKSIVTNRLELDDVGFDIEWGVNWYSHLTNDSYIAYTNGAFHCLIDGLLVEVDDIE